MKPMIGRTMLLVVASTLLLVGLPLVSGERQTPPDQATIRSGDDVPVQQYDWGWIRWVMSSDVVDEAEMTMGIVQIEANQSNPVHLHPNCTEYLHVLSGTLEHRIGDRWVTLKPGDTIRIPPGVVHAARATDEACRVVVVFDTGKRQMVVVEE